jgi:hypothetical protein
MVGAVKEVEAVAEEEEVVREFIEVPVVQISVFSATGGTAGVGTVVSASSGWT